MDLLTVLTLAFFVNHEIDAMTAREWRMLPVLSRLDDHRGREIFVALHAPLAAALLFGLTGAHAEAWALGISAFSVFHLAAHVALHRHPENGFRRATAWVWIVGAGVSGAVHLALSLL